MALVRKLVVDVKTERLDIKCEVTKINTKFCIEKTDPPLIKQEPQPVEIDINDIFSLSSEEDMKVKWSILDSNKINKPIIDSIMGTNKHEETNKASEDFNTVSNLASDEQLVVNFSRNLENIPNRPKEVIAQAYRTYEGTNCTKDLRKVIVNKPPEEVIRIASHEYTTLACNKHICNHCQCPFKDKRILKRHIRMKHREVTTTYQCPYCSYKSRNYLWSHIIHRHKEEKEVQWFECYKCNVKVKTKSTLRRHLRTHLSKEELKAILRYCPICGKSFTESDALKRHKKFVHDKEKAQNRIQCKECEYSCRANSLLKHHIDVAHTYSHQLPTLQCKQCDFKTKYEFKLRKHIIFHEKPLSCEECGFLANGVTKLRLHQMTHKKQIEESELKYRCTKCDYKTYRHYSFQVHLLNHLKPHEIQYFYCYHCDFKAKRKDNLKTHVLRHFKKNDGNFAVFYLRFLNKEEALTYSPY